MAFAFIVEFSELLKQNTDTNTEAQGDILVIGVEPVPNLEAVLVACFGRSTKCVSASNPTVNNESFDAQLIAYGSH